MATLKIVDLAVRLPLILLKVAVVEIANKHIDQIKERFFSHIDKSGNDRVRKSAVEAMQRMKTERDTALENFNQEKTVREAAVEAKGKAEGECQSATRKEYTATEKLNNANTEITRVTTYTELKNKVEQFKKPKRLDSREECSRGLEDRNLHPDFGRLGYYRARCWDIKAVSYRPSSSNFRSLSINFWQFQTINR